jgi:hypothetical protein
MLCNACSPLYPRVVLGVYIFSKFSVVLLKYNTCPTIPRIPQKDLIKKRVQGSWKKVLSLVSFGL